MGLFNFINNLSKPNVNAENADTNEEYQINTISLLDITMTPELSRRKQEEELRKEYCVPSLKYGKIL